MLLPFWHVMIVLGRKCEREDGQGLAEYTLLLALVAIAAISALKLLGGQAATQLSGVGTSIADSTTAESTSQPTPTTTPQDTATTPTTPTTPTTTPQDTATTPTTTPQDTATTPTTTTTESPKSTITIAVDATKETIPRTGVYFLVKTSILDQAKSQIDGLPVTYSIIDATTQRTVATFPGSSNGQVNCTIVQTRDYRNNAETFTGAAVAPYQACGLGSVSIPASDDVLLSVSFAGNSQYLPATTSPSAADPQGTDALL
jgi:Flp pilus assembly pilin Flp